MTMTKICVDQVDAPEIAATELLLKTLIDDDDRIAIPIDVEAVAKSLGIEILCLPLENGTDGLLVKDLPNKPFKAVVNSESSIRRRRFTLAHEIGHYVKKYQQFPSNETAGLVEKRNELSSAGVDPEEIWANQFAAALLMPAPIVMRYWASGMRIEEMADKLNVSIAALGHRLDNLKLV